ncbi:FAD binding domain-containing protein [Natrinema ejinorense]|uniref:FAD-binding PCMH-type domain-containing protein n=1 Tax=Natrinema ejinorense TaxID=373386 RepID=A0A2A5QTE3_9EURY|nr:xanthine dehydrogenase family protein subunit M [Natrinema ejinorense]PCR90043.1 hypothetical protein CP557_05510 [Natrinema ejinorense]
MKPTAFHYQRPETIDDAVDVLASEGEEATVLAGGQSLIPRMNYRTAKPDVVVDLNHVADLEYVHSEGDELVIGAMTRQSAVRDHSDVTEHCPLLADALQYVGHKPTRHRGTIGGNLANADPRSELPAVVTALEGSLVVRNGDGERVIDAADFFHGGMDTALESDELLTELRVPVQEDGVGYGFQEEAIVDSDWPIAGVAATLEVADGECRSVRLAYAGVDASPTRIEDAEAAIEGEPVGPDSFEAAASAARENVSVTEQETAESAELRVNQVGESDHPSATVHADPGYKRELVGALTYRALEQAHDRV